MEKRSQKLQSQLVVLGAGRGGNSSSWLAPSTRQQAAGSSGHVAARADEEVFGPKLLEQILLCSIAQPQFPLLPLPPPLSQPESSCKIMNAHAQATQQAGQGGEWSEGVRGVNLVVSQQLGASN